MLVNRGYLTEEQLDAMQAGDRVVDEDGDTLERLADGRWVVINVPIGSEHLEDDIWPARLLRARKCWTRR